MTFNILLQFSFIRLHCARVTLKHAYGKHEVHPLREIVADERLIRLLHALNKDLAQIFEALLYFLLLVLVVLKRHSHDLSDKLAQRKVLVYKHVEKAVGNFLGVNKILRWLILKHVVEHGLEASRLQLQFLLHLNQIKH